MKLLYKFIFFSLLEVSISSCLTSYLFETIEDSDNSKIHYKQAQSELATSVAVLSARCQGFHESLYNYETSYFFMTAYDPCGQLDRDPIKGCADREYYSKKEVNVCLALITADPCVDAAGGDPTSEPEEMKRYRFSTFALCSSTFHSPMPMPMFL